MVEQAGAFTLLFSVEAVHTSCQVLHLLSKVAEWKLGNRVFTDTQRLWHLQRFMSGEQVWTNFIRHDFLQIVCLVELQYWIRREPRKGCQVITSLRQALSAVPDSSTLEFYGGLVEGRCYDRINRPVCIGNILAGTYRYIPEISHLGSVTKESYLFGIKFTGTKVPSAWTDGGALGTMILFFTPTPVPYHW